MTQGDYAGPPSPGNPYAPGQLYGGVGDWVELRGLRGLGETTDAVAKARAELAATRAKRAEVQQQKAALQSKNSGGGAFPALVAATPGPSVIPTAAEGAKSMVLPLLVVGAGYWLLTRGK